MTLKRFWRSSQDASAPAKEPPALGSDEPGWEYIALAHRIQNSVQAYHLHYANGEVHPSERSFSDVADAVRNVSTQVQVLKAIIGTFGRLLSPESMNGAIGMPGESGDMEKIECLASDFGEAYGMLLAWMGETRASRVPIETRQLYLSFAAYAERPLNQIDEFVDQLVANVDQAVSALRAGKEADHDVVVKLSPEIDPELVRIVEHELDVLAAAARPDTRAVTALEPSTTGPIAVATARVSAANTPDHSANFLDPVAALAAGGRLCTGDFVAIDFETATRSRASACAVGLAFVSGGRISDVKRWLIQPPGNEYEGINISIHGITPKMTADSPEFAEVWPEVMSLIPGMPLVAHYAAFDIGVLRASLAASSEPWPTLTYLCTCVLSRHAWPGRISYRLDDIVNAYGELGTFARLTWTPSHDSKLERHLPNVQVPTLVLGADDDWIVPNVYSDRFAELIPGAKLERVPGTGHGLIMQEPDRAAEVIRGFIQGVAR